MLFNGMRPFTLVAVGLLTFAQHPDDFSGTWRLNPERSQLQNLPDPPGAFLRIESQGSQLRISEGSEQGGPFTVRDLPLDGKEAKTRAGGSTFSTIT